MKKLIYISLLCLLFISGSILGYLFAIKTMPDAIVSKISQLNSSRVFILDDGSELSIINHQNLIQINSVSIDNNDDPGDNPAEDYFGVLGTLHYPFNEMEITDTDEIVIIVKPHPELKTNRFDAYIACNTAVVKQVKNKMYYFSTPIGTAPAFSISIYKNGYLVEKSDVFGLHLSELEGQFKPLNRMNDVTGANVTAYISE